VRLRRRDRRLQGQVSGNAVNELNPDAGSADEIEAIKANKDNKGPQAPDVIDVGLAFGPSGEGRRPDPALQGCDLGRSRTRQGRRRPLVRRLLRRDVVPGEQGPREPTPADWADLLKPEYANQVALAGDPRASNQAILAFMRPAGRRRCSRVKPLARQGLEFFKPS
jgi:putative spermidine/putrescine transport system substrate-binding protein